MEKFHKYFPTGTLRAISEEALSTSDQAKQWKKWHDDINKNGPHNPEVTVQNYVLQMPEGNSTYIRRQLDRSARRWRNTVHLLDLKDQTRMGIRRFDFDPDSKQNPHPHVVGTVSEYPQEGYGTRGLKIMNALSRGWFGLPLRSDLNLNENAIKTWDGLVRNGEAEYLDADWHYRFR